MMPAKRTPFQQSERLLLLGLKHFSSSLDIILAPFG